MENTLQIPALVVSFPEVERSIHLDLLPSILVFALLSVLGLKIGLFVIVNTVMHNFVISVHTRLDDKILPL